MVHRQANNATVNGTTASGAVRGSSLLLAGKVLALALNFLSQVLMVRYLTKSDYGSFAYALSVVMLFKGIALFGIPDTVARYLPIFRERGEWRALLGTMLVAFGVVIGLGLILASSVALVMALSGDMFISDRTALDLAVILAFLIPLEALNDLLTSLFAVFASTRTIFFRRLVLAPALRLALIVALIAFNAGVVTLAAGYLAISAAGVLIYFVMFMGLLRSLPVAPSRTWRGLSYPMRELLTFALPAVSTSVVWLLMEPTNALLLGYFHDAAAVADFRAVLPVAKLNQFVLLSFAILYAPLAARAYARGDKEDLSDLYWQTSAWIMVLTFPIFILSCAFAGPLVTMLFGERYADSATILTVLSAGYFFHSSLGFNGLTLRVFRRLRYSITMDVSAAVLNIILALVLVPRFGALGAAIGTSATMAAHNVLKQVGVWRYSGIPMFPRRYATVYAVVGTVTAFMLALGFFVDVNIVSALALGVLASMAVLWAALGTLRVEATFPEIARLPVIKTVLRLLLRRPS